MKVTLHMAVSVDGYVARVNGDSDWVSATDEELFLKRANEAGCIVVGNKTFEQYRGKIYPVENVLNIVLTRQEHSGILQNTRMENVAYAASPQEALTLAGEKGFENVLIAGGGKVSGAYLKENLLDEIYLTIHPLVLGDGIKLFDGADEAKLELLDSKPLNDGLVELHYKVLK